MYLHQDELAQVVHMQDVADLFARAAVTDVAQRAAKIVRQHPERGDALIHLAELPRPGDDAATINHGF